MALRRLGPFLPRLFACALALAWPPAGVGAKEAFLPPPPGPDRDFFVRHIAGWMEANCATCHRSGAGAFRMAPLDSTQSEEARRRLDFERVRPFVKATAPWESRLFLKVLAPGEGGDPHVGGAFIREEEEAHDLLLDFVSGATLTNLPPEAWFEQAEVRAKPHETVIIDGRASFDRDRDDMQRLAYWWELVARPAESRVIVQDRRASRLEVTPDTGGSYVFRLRVGDGKVWSAPRAVTIEVFDYVKIKRSEPGGISGLEQVEAKALRQLRRLYLDVLGRAPTPPEVLAEERKGVRGLVRNILLRSESGRAWVEDVTFRFGLSDDYRPVSEQAASLALRVPAESVTPPQLEAVLASDPSFLKRHPPGRPLAEAIARLLLDRPASAAEIRAALVLAEGRPVDMPGIGQVADSRQWLLAILASEVFERHAVARRLSHFLDSGDLRKQMPAAVAAVRAGNKPWRTFLEGILLEPHYLDRRRLRPKGETTFLRGLFIDLLERKPTDRELAALVRAVGRMPGQSAAFAAVVRILIDSGEAPLPLLVDIRDAPRWLTDRFLRYLGRRPTPAEMKAYGEVLLHPRGGPELVIHALLTGPEYACR